MENNKKIRSFLYPAAQRIRDEFNAARWMDMEDEDDSTREN